MFLVTIACAFAGAEGSRLYRQRGQIRGNMDKLNRESSRPTEEDEVEKDAQQDAPGDADKPRR